MTLVITILLHFNYDKFSVLICTGCVPTFHIAVQNIKYFYSEYEKYFLGGFHSHLKWILSSPQIMKVITLELKRSSPLANDCLFYFSPLGKITTNSVFQYRCSCTHFLVTVYCTHFLLSVYPLLV